jgi:uncharacterized protein
MDRAKPAVARPVKAPAARRQIKPAIAEQESTFSIHVRRSAIHRWGVMAGERIPAKRRVIEYKGARISVNRLVRQFRSGLRQFDPDRVTLFRLNRHWVIDGGDGGNGAVIINHSCDPNLRTRFIRGHIYYFSCRDIKKGEELLVDYRFPATSQRKVCHCGSKKCRGTMNRRA